MFLSDNWYKLTTKNKPACNNVVDQLDVAILQNDILEPILGIENPRNDKRIDLSWNKRSWEIRKKM